MILCVIEWILIFGFLMSWFSHDCDDNQEIGEIESPFGEEPDNSDRPDPPGRFR